MGQSDAFRPGQRVRIRPTANSDYAGCRGVVIYVGNTVCDVRIRLKRKPSRVYETYIGTFHKDDLETFQRNADLVHYQQGRRRSHSLGTFWLLLSLSILVLVFLIIRYKVL